MQRKPLPIGVDNFEDLICNGYYYIDRTMLVKQLLEFKASARFKETMKDAERAVEQIRDKHYGQN